MAARIDATRASEAQTEGMRMGNPTEWPMIDETNELVDRLRMAHMEYADGIPCGYGDPINPDGLDAADTITAQQQEIERLRAERDEARSSYINLFSVIADIREASGLGARPMLGELAAEMGKVRAERDTLRAVAEAVRWLENATTIKDATMARLAVGAAFDALDEEPGK